MKVGQRCECGMTQAQIDRLALVIPHEHEIPFVHVSIELSLDDMRISFHERRKTIGPIYPSSNRNWYVDSPEDVPAVSGPKSAPTP